MTPITDESEADRLYDTVRPGSTAEAAALPWWVPGVALFWRQGYPGVMVTDTAYLRNPHYHTRSDTPETLDYPRFARATLGLAGALRLLSFRT